MTAREDRRYYTIGELASLYGLPKQTLMYYANVGLLVPAFVHENGYRYYAVQQYLELEIILNLRKLDVSVKDIKTFLDRRSPAALTRLLERQLALGDDIVRTIRAKQESVRRMLASLEEQKHLVLDVFQTVTLPEQRLFASPPLADREPHKPFSRIASFAEHTQRLFGRHSFRSVPTGWIIRQDSFFAGDFYATWKYFIALAPEQPAPDVALIPGGLFVVIYFSGTYYQMAPKLHQALVEYLARNDLQATGDVYIQPIKDGWETASAERHIVKLSLPVRAAHKPLR